jgi:hypothetical protein
MTNDPAEVRALINSCVGFDLVPSSGDRLDTLTQNAGATDFAAAMARALAGVVSPHRPSP